MFLLNLNLPSFTKSSTVMRDGHPVTDGEPEPLETTPGCDSHLSDSEYQHLVDLGHWHHNRRRRRNRRF